MPLRTTVLRYMLSSCLTKNICTNACMIILSGVRIFHFTRYIKVICHCVGHNYSLRGKHIGVIHYWRFRTEQSSDGTCEITSLSSSCKTVLLSPTEPCVAPVIPGGKCYTQLDLYAGNVPCAAMIQSGSSVTFLCDGALSGKTELLSPSGRNKMTCRNGKWDSDRPRCTG